MDEYWKLIDSHKNIKRRCFTSDELQRLVYKEMCTPQFELYQPSKASQSQGSSAGEEGRECDPSTSRLLESQSRSLSSANVGHVLSDEQRKSFKGLVLVAKDLIEKRKLNKGNLAGNLAKIRNLPLEVLWWYHCSDIVHITIYIALNLDDSSELERLGSGLNELMGVASGEGVEAAVSSDLVSALARLVHGPDPPDALQDARKACCIILQSVVRRQLAAIKEHTGALWWLQRLVGPSSSLPSPVVRSFATELLLKQLTEPPFVSVHQALARQPEWSFGLSHHLLTGFFSLVLGALGSTPETLDVLVSVLEGGDEVNWRAVLVCVSTFLHCKPAAATRMEGLVSELVVRALSSDSMESLLLSFLLARQCAVEGTEAGCLSYPAWFKRTFGHKNSSLASTQSQARFLLDFLTQLVPHEPASCLKTHVDQAPWVPTACRSQLQDYLLLASTRLRDLGRGSTEVIAGLFLREPDHQVTSLAEQVRYDIDRAVSHFEATGKVHLALLEGSIFKKKYFECSFLPVLLKPRVSPSSNDPHTLLIDALLKKGKISLVQHNNYLSQCLAASSSSSG